MDKLVIAMETDLTLAKKILPSLYYMFYKSRIKSLLKIIESRLKDYKSEDSTKTKRIFIEEGDEEYIAQRKKELEEFLFSSANKLEDNDDIKKMKNDRMIQQIARRFRKGSKKIRDKAMKMALREDCVLNFFTNIGISVVWEVIHM